MSYEGYEQYLCADGHYWTGDCWSAWDAEKPSCPYCKKPATFSNSVDQTNGPDVGRAVIEEVSPAKTCQCKCGNRHETEPARYKVKTDDSGRPVRVSDEEYDDFAFCGRCGGGLTSEGFCTDQTCPFDKHKQNCLVGWTGHPAYDEVVAQVGGQGGLGGCCSKEKANAV